MHARFLFLFITLFVFLSACGSDAIQNDLIQYINKDIKPLAPKEKEAADLYASVTGVNYTNDEKLYTTMTKKVIPEYNDFIAKLENVRPQTEELKKVHEEYIDAANIQMSAFTEIVAGLEEQNPDKITEANDKLAKGRKMIRQYQDDLQKLAKDHDVKLK